jgi:integrase
MVLLGAWCALRSGEVRELRRKDMNTTTGVLRVERQVVRTQSGMIVSPPKSAAGVREIPMARSLLPVVRRHLLQHAQPGQDGLLFPSPRGQHLSTGSFADMYDAARREAGRPDLRFHDLRHTGLTYVAQAGATLAELQSWAGHSTAQAALRYQHATSDRKTLLAGQLDAMRGRPE